MFPYFMCFTLWDHGHYISIHNSLIDIFPHTQHHAKSYWRLKFAVSSEGNVDLPLTYSVVRYFAVF